MTERTEPMAVTWAELREAIAAVFYRRLPAADELGQARIDRATDRVVTALGYGLPDAGEEEGEA